MKTPGGIRKIWIFCAAICTSILLFRGAAQKNMVPDLPPDFRQPSSLTSFFEREETVGSPFLARYWIAGSVELANHRTIPTPEQPLLFNYNKLDYIIYFINRDHKISSYPIDSVLAFELNDNYTVFSFEKIPWISGKFFLMPMIKSERGYSLYKRLYTKLYSADFSNKGYFKEGRSYDEYADYFRYYITYPENRSYRKLNLNEKEIRRALKRESGLVEQFFSLHDVDINEQNLIGLIQYINEKKFPE